MNSWKQYAFSAIVCAMSCGIVSQIAADAKRKSMMQLICGTVLALSLLQPFSRINLEEFLQFRIENLNLVDSYISMGEKTAFQAQEDCIKASCEEYILNRAKILGAEIQAQVLLDDDLIPVRMEITGNVDTYTQKELQKILTMDLGIPKENQKWIWNQESNNS